MKRGKSVKILNARQKRFVEELVAGATQKDAAIRAGYSANTADSIASRLLKDDAVCAYRREYAKTVYDRLGVTAESLALELEEIKRRCMQAVPHESWDSEAKAYVPDGTWTFDAGGAIKAIRQQAALMGVAVKVELDAGERLEDFLKKTGGSRDF